MSILTTFTYKLDSTLIILVFKDKCSASKLNVKVVFFGECQVKYREVEEQKKPIKVQQTYSIFVFE